MTRSNYYIITGGPGSGKTSLLETLAAKGYSYIPDTARKIIKDRLSKGLPPRPDPKTFAKEIFKTDWNNFISNSGSNSVTFFDRSFMDSACMLFDADKNEYEKIKDSIRYHEYNNIVFFAPPWKEIYRNDSERDQSFEESIRVYNRLKEWYELHDYKILPLPFVSIENRVDFILNQLFKKS